jgi:hypothetical protein
MSALDPPYTLDEQDGGYEHPDIEIQAARYDDDDEDANMEPFLEAIYAFKMATNAAFREYYMGQHSHNTRGLQEYQDYLRAIQTLWDSKQRTLHASLTAPYKKLPADVQKTLQTMLDAIHASNNAKHTYASNYWIRRLFIECAGSTNIRSFEACKRLTQGK